MLSEMPDRLAMVVVQAEALLREFDAERWRASRGAGKWSSLEVLGHLIDSAANNHQRMVRALAQPRLDWPGYDQMAHVSVQRYASADAAVCLALWTAYNLHISHVMRQIDSNQGAKLCGIDGAMEMSLSDLALDYVAHLEHHAKQLLPGEPIHYSGMPWPPADPSRQWPA